MNNLDISNLSAEELWEYLEDTEDIDLRDLKLYRYYSALSGDKEVVSLIDYHLEKYYGKGEDE